MTFTFFMLHICTNLATYCLHNTINMNRTPPPKSIEFYRVIKPERTQQSKIHLLGRCGRDHILV